MTMDSRLRGGFNHCPASVCGKAGFCDFAANAIDPKCRPFPGICRDRYGDSRYADCRCSVDLQPAAPTFGLVCYSSAGSCNQATLPICWRIGDLEQGREPGGQPAKSTKRLRHGKGLVSSFQGPGWRTIGHSVCYHSSSRLLPMYGNRPDGCPRLLEWVGISDDERLFSAGGGRILASY